MKIIDNGSSVYPLTMSSVPTKCPLFMMPDRYYSASILLTIKSKIEEILTLIEARFTYTGEFSYQCSNEQKVIFSINFFTHDSPESGYWIELQHMQGYFGDGHESDFIQVVATMKEYFQSTGIVNLSYQPPITSSYSAPESWVDPELEYW